MKEENYSLDKIGKLMVDTLVNALGQYQLGSSALANSIKYVINGNVISIEMNEYGIYLDKGTAPHMPPVDGIQMWADDKGINVWAVAYSIKEKGTKAKPFLNSLDNILSEIDTLVEEAAFKQLSLKTDDIFTKYFKN